jgi:hypothetical protein
MIKVMRLLMLVLISSILFQSCEYEWIEPDEAEIPDVISYSSNIQPIFNRSCNTSGCHATGGPAPDLTTENSYNALLSGGYVNNENPESSSLYTSVKFGSMQVYAQPSDAEYILRWIQQGALNN